MRWRGWSNKMGAQLLAEGVIDDRVIDDQRSLTVKEFLFYEKMSQSTYYKLKRHGLGPEETTIPIPGMNFVRITAQARRDWHAKLAELRSSEAGELERARRADHATQAGKLAAASPLHVSRRGSRKARR
jgi:hypothetical protein